MSKSGSSFFSFLIGTLVGGIIGILYAPDKGSNTRSKLSFQLDKLKNQLENFLNEIVTEKELYENEAKNKGNKIVNEAKSKAKQLLDDVNGLLGEIKKEDKKK